MVMVMVIAKYLIKNLRTIYLLYFFTQFVRGETQWVWKCDSSKGFCTRSFSAEISDETNYPTIETCRLVCGKYGALWPRPTANVKLGTDLLKFSSRSISVTISAEPEALDFVQETVRYFLNTIIKENASSCPQTANSVIVVVSVVSSDISLDWNTDESYSIDVKSTGTSALVEISAETAFGARHALETLSQLIEAYPDSEKSSKCLAIVKEVKIGDAPVYPHRGLLIDTARNFQSVSTIKKHIDAMAASKLNVLHWHITDTQSFPLELSRLPNMTKFGAYSDSAIYHPDDVTEVQAYAKSLGIRVIIEIDAPSHAGNGWQWGPESGLGDLAICVNKAPYRSYCIQPPCGQLNPINENVYKVLQDLFSDVVDMVPTSGVIHMGGDEVFIPCWNSTPEIVRHLNGNTSMEAFLDLWSEFQDKALHAYDAATGNTKTPVVLWTSHLTEVDVIEKYLSKERYVIQTWVPADDELPSNLLKLGYKIIVSTKDAWYLDHGFWGTTVYHNWRTVYNNKIPDRNSGTLGGETCMWGEYVDDFSVESRIWPRAAAAAERLWSNPDTTSDAAEPRFYRHRERLVARGTNAEALVPRWCYQNEGDCK